jgi:hypothetical protein
VAVYYAGLDLGQSAGYTALAVVQKVPTYDPKTAKHSIELHLRYLERYPLKTPYTDIADRVKRLLTGPPFTEAAGVLFTANPANGRRSEAVISAAWDLGESVVSGSVTTDDVVVEKESGRLLSRETADKEMMTVYAVGGTEERPVPEERRRQPVLDDEEAAKLARYGATIEDHYGTPQDIEWALAAGEFFIVQSRPITALPEPEADPPTDWSVLDPKAMYVRASIVEQMPDPLSPLFADLLEGAVVRSLRKLLDEFLGERVLREGDLGFPPSTATLTTITVSPPCGGSP